MDMKSYMLDLNSIEKVKGFVSVIGNIEGYFDLVSGRYVVDAKSIMGIFSMDLSGNSWSIWATAGRRSRRRSHRILLKNNWI